MYLDVPALLFLLKNSALLATCDGGFGRIVFAGIFTCGGHVYECTYCTGCVSSQACNLIADGMASAGASMQNKFIIIAGCPQLSALKAPYLSTFYALSFQGH